MNKKAELKKFLTDNNACPEGRDWALDQGSMEAVYDNCPRGDWLMWMLRKAGKIDKKTAVKLACKFALKVLPIYENKYSRKEPRRAIEAALAWVDDPTEEKCILCRKAANAAFSVACAAAADAAADAAYSARAAASSAARAAAYAAADAAYYAANAAYSDAAACAAAEAAYSATYAAAYARRAERKAQANLIRKTVNNPWRTT